MRILHITQFLGVGGLEKLLLSLMLEQQKLGHKPVLLVYGDDQAWVEYFRSFGLTVINDYRKRPGYDTGVIQKIKKHWRDYDVIHTHDINPAMYMAPLIRLLRIPFTQRPKWLHTAHGMDHIKQSTKTIFYERFFTNQADIIVGVASHVCRTYIDVLGAAPSKVKLVENGIAIPTLEDKPKTRVQLEGLVGHPLAGKVWICVSRVVPLKDQELIINAATKFTDQSFVLVGPSGDDAYWNKLKGMLPLNVYMIGANNDVSSLLKEADYFVSASRHEGIPLAVLEAGAHMLPSVLSDIPGHKTLQKDEKEIAEFFSVGDVNSLVKSVQLIIDDVTRAKMLAQQLHKTVVQHFSAEKMTRQYLELYEGMQIEKAH